MDDFQAIDSDVECELVPITASNYYRVEDFRGKYRIQEYKRKIMNDEIGFFAEHHSQMLGSIWSTMNTTSAPHVVRGFIRLLPGEALIHDIVTGDKYRGMGIGPFMVSRLLPILLESNVVKRVIIDVNVKNNSSLHMMNKIGLKVVNTTLSISAFGDLVFHRVIRSGR
jgi:ribosomal protein S18 acetylase RimI-like enzyme